MGMEIDPQQTIMQVLQHDISDGGKRVAGGFLTWLVMHFTAEEFAALATGVYFSLQAAYLVWKWAREARGKKNAGSDKE